MPVLTCTGDPGGTIAPSPGADLAGSPPPPPWPASCPGLSPPCRLGRILLAAALLSRIASGSGACPGTPIRLGAGWRGPGYPMPAMAAIPPRWRKRRPLRQFLRFHLHLNVLARAFGSVVPLPFSAPPPSASLTSRPPSGFRRLQPVAGGIWWPIGSARLAHGGGERRHPCRRLESGRQ